MFSLFLEYYFVILVISRLGFWGRDLRSVCSSLWLLPTCDFRHSNILYICSPQNGMVYDIPVVGSGMHPVCLVAFGRLKSVLVISRSRSAHYFRSRIPLLLHLSTYTPSEPITPSEVWWPVLTLAWKVIEKQWTGTGAIKWQIPLLKPKREINKYYNRQNTMRTNCLPSGQLFPKRWPLSNPNWTKSIMNKHKAKHHSKSDTKTANRDHIRTTALERSVMNYWGLKLVLRAQPHNKRQQEG